MKNLINKMTNKIGMIYFATSLLLFNKLVLALATGALPSEITTNTDKFESGLAWGLKIGGMGAIIYGCIAFARNKLQGQAADTVVTLILGLGGAAVGLGWWLGQSATSSAGFAF
jgi:uncharacterized membrane protein YedE/YeeE